jgi:amino acid permease
VGVAADQDLAARSSSDSAVKTVAKVVLLAVTALVLAVVGQLAAASTLLVVGAGAAVVFAGFVVSARREVGGQRRTSHLRGLWCVALVLVLAGGALIGVAGTNAVAEGALGAGIGAGILSVAVAAVVWFRPQMLQPSPQRHSHHL